MMTKVHASIRKAPEFTNTTKKVVNMADRKYKLPEIKLTKAQREKRIAIKIKKMFKKEKKWLKWYLNKIIHVYLFAVLFNLW